MSLIGLAMRVGKLITDEELTIVEIHKQKAELVFVATDTSENTRRKIRDKSSYYEVPCSELFSETEIAQMVGKPRKVFGIMDAGFAERTKELTEGQEGDCMGNKRIYGLAKELKKSSKNVMEKAQQLGIDAKNHMGAVIGNDEKRLQQAFKDPSTKQQAAQQASRKPANQQPNDQRKKKATNSQQKNRNSRSYQDRG